MDNADIGQIVSSSDNLQGARFLLQTLLVSAGPGSEPWTHLKVSILFLFYCIINELTANEIFSRSSHHLVSS